MMPQPITSFFDTTLNFPTQRMKLYYNGQDSIDGSSLTVPLSRGEFRRTFEHWDYDHFVRTHCRWDREPEPIDISNCYVLFPADGHRSVAIAELHFMYVVRDAINDGVRLIFPIRPKNVTVYASRLSNTVKTLFPAFCERQALDHAKAIIAKFDKRKPKPSLKKPKPPLKRLSNERWRLNQ